MRSIHNRSFPFLIGSQVDSNDFQYPLDVDSLVEFVRKHVEVHHSVEAKQKKTQNVVLLFSSIIEFR